MSRPNKVSVIIPTFSHKQWIMDTLNSVFAQTYTNYEVLVIDDGSTDGTVEILKPLIDAGQIRYIRTKNNGMAAARNTGIAAATGDLVSFLDDDDLWPVNKLAWQVEHLNVNPSCNAIAGAAQLLDGKTTRMLKFSTEPLTVMSLFDGCPFVSPGQLLIRTKVLIDAGGFPTGFWGADDFALWFELAHKGGFHRVNKLALSYRLHENNASKNTPRMLRSLQAVLELQIKKLPVADVKIARQKARFLLADDAAYKLLVVARPRLTLNWLRQVGVSLLFWFKFGSFRNYSAVWQSIKRRIARQYCQTRF